MIGEARLLRFPACSPSPCTPFHFEHLPAPEGPTQSQQASSPTLAEMPWRMSLMCGHASGLPPGMMDGPYRAPSSPPDTPDPTKRKPTEWSGVEWRGVGVKWEVGGCSAVQCNDNVSMNVRTRKSQCRRAATVSGWCRCRCALPKLSRRQVLPGSVNGNTFPEGAGPTHIISTHPFLPSLCTAGSNRRTASCRHQ